MEIESTIAPSSSSSAVMDLHAICRLCLSDKNDSLKSLFDEILGPNRLPQKIEHLLQLKICKNDKFPTMICNDCIIRLDTWFAYRKQCHRNQTKLAEWIKIEAKSSSSSSTNNDDEKIQDAVLQIKKEPTDDTDKDTSGIMVPIKVELNYDEEFPDESTSVPQNESIIMSAENPADVSTNNLETDDDRQCPDCGKVFGTFLNRRRHQNAMHTKKERRYQMKEINILKREHEESSESEMKPQILKTEIKKPKIYNSEAMDPIIHLTAENSYEPTTSVVNSTTNDAVVKKSKTEEIIKDVKLKLLSENDEKKIEFAAGLRLLQKDSAPIELEPLSKIEQSYIEKCRAMVSMFHTLQCACHNGQHKTLRNLLSHLRETRVWFPLFTCYNCMISLTDRSTFTRHYTKCPKPQLETLITLSNVRKRSEVKVRTYQNFKCNRCKFLFSFHEDFCKHVDEEHANGTAPFYCSCNCTFDSAEEFRNHCYSSCILSYYCDICFETTSTNEEFIKHAQEHHDSSEGFILLQDDNYLPRSQHFRHNKEANNADAEGNNAIVEGKRERRKSTKDPVMVQIYDREVPNNNHHETATKDLSVTGIKKLIQMDETNSISWNKNPTRCPLCRKQYSTVNNMVRHYKGHIEKQEVELPKIDNIDSGNEDLYTCPDCGGVYPASQWSQHLEEKHTAKKCTECDKEFQFEAELNQHRSVHLNIKVYRDSVTHSYKSTMVNLNESRDMLEICEICDEMFYTKEELLIHKNDEHEDDGVITNLVDISSNLEVTIEDGDAAVNEEIEPIIENDEKPFCEPCNRPFASDKSYREHVLSKHDSSLLKKGRYPKKCVYCDKTCGTGAALKAHMMWHDRMNMTELEKSKSEFPKKCEYCDKICSTKAGLYLHTQMHERVTLGELKKKKDDNINKRNNKILDDVIDETEMDIDKEDESYFTCKRCFKVFGNKSKLKEHLKSHGVFTKTSPNKKTRKVLCDQCHVSFENRDALIEHKAEEHNGMDDEEDDFEHNNDRATETTTLFNCQYCEHISYTKQEQKVHKDSHKWNSKTNELNCKLCKITFSNIKELTNHMQKQHNEPIRAKIERGPKGFRCPLCPKLFQSHNAMTTHSGWHKRLGNYPSVVVENTPQARTASKLIRKQKVLKKLTTPKAEPLEMPEFQCSICFIELSNETALQIHCLEKHGNLDASVLIPRCETCNQDFDTQEGYEKHKRFHVFLERQIKQEKNQIIPTAGPPALQNVQNIAETYQNNKKYCCSWCNSSFTRQDTLNSHIKSHHKEFVRTDFECPDCKRVFDKQNALSIHLKVHQKQKNFLMHQSQGPSSSVGKVYVCSLCNMAFNYPKDLRMHTIKAHPF